LVSFGARFKELRKNKRLTQQELTDKINEQFQFTISKSSISAYENDISIPEMNTLISFAEFFEVSIDYLLGRSNIKNPNVEVYAQAFHSISTEELTQEEVDLLENMIEQFKKNRGIRK